MKVLETRTRQDGIVRRRYRVAADRCVTTYELPESVVAAMGRQRLERIMARYNLAEQKRQRSDRIRELLAQGWKPTAIAHELGISEAAVRYWRKRNKEN